MVLLTKFQNFLCKTVIENPSFGTKLSVKSAAKLKLHFRKCHYCFCYHIRWFRCFIHSHFYSSNKKKVDSLELRVLLFFSLGLRGWTCMFEDLCYIWCSLAKHAVSSSVDLDILWFALWEQAGWQSSKMLRFKKEQTETLQTSFKHWSETWKELSKVIYPTLNPQFNLFFQWYSQYYSVQKWKHLLEISNSAKPIIFIHCCCKEQTVISNTKFKRL